MWMREGTLRGCFLEENIVIFFGIFSQNLVK